MTTEQACKWTEDGYRVKGEHFDECDKGDECAGCWPCHPKSDLGHPLEHCQARKRCVQHVEPGTLTCVKCVNRGRTILAKIVNLYALMPGEARHKGVESEAANLAGPAADPEAWSWRKTAASKAGRLATIEDDDPHHPHLVLGRWDFMLREDYDQPTSERVTVSGSAAYLDGQLARLAQDEHQDYADFLREVSTCLAHMEAVLHDGSPIERGAPCPKCGASALIRDYGTRAGDDRWRCPECKEWWSDNDYRSKVTAVYVQVADRLTTSQIRETYRVAEGTVRGWAAKVCEDGDPLVRKRGKDESGRIVYDVADVLAVRDGARKERARDIA